MKDFDASSTPPLRAKTIIFFTLFALIPLALLHYSLFFPLYSPSPPPIENEAQRPQYSTPSPPPPPPAQLRPPCDYSAGRWVRDEAGPQYNGSSCSTIKDGQNCMSHGRPDTGYLHWRWRPHDCPLPAFQPQAFLRLIAHKHLAFVGDSMARNQLESLLCLLAAVSPPELVYRDGEQNKFRRWVFRGHDATVSVFWSPFLVAGTEKSAESGLDHNELFLDRVDERWIGELRGIDMVILSIGHWFLHPAVYLEGGETVGCHHCPGLNHSEVGFFGVFRKAINTTLSEIIARQGQAGGAPKLVVVTTFSPAHFEGEWDKAGACRRKEPYEEGEKEMEYMDKEMRRIETEEAATAATKAGVGATAMTVEALDVTMMAMLRPDGHPGPYMRPNPFAGATEEADSTVKVPNDCVHWCLPGPIDAWNEILLEKIKNWVENMGIN